MANENQLATVWVTGSSGVIGRAVCTELINSGHRLVFPNCGPKAGQKRIDLSLNDLDFSTYFDVPPSLIVHGAALVPGNGFRDTEANASLTRRIDCNVLATARKLDVPCVYFSGCSLYVSESESETVETSPLKSEASLSPYLAAKLTGDKLFRSEANAAVLRISSPVGSGLPIETVVSKFMNAAQAGGALEVWGTGCREQDFIDVRDIARIVRLWCRSPKNGVFNVASGVPVTMRRLAELVIAAVGKGKVILGRKDDPLEGSRSRISISNARRSFSWQPNHDLTDSLNSILCDQ